MINDQHTDVLYVEEISFAKDEDDDEREAFAGGASGDTPTEEARNLQAAMQSSFACVAPSAAFMMAAESIVQEPSEAPGFSSHSVAPITTTTTAAKDNNAPAAAPQMDEPVTASVGRDDYRELDDVDHADVVASPVGQPDAKRRRWGRRSTRKDKHTATATVTRRPKATPLPKFQITILVLIMMTESIGAFMLLPFVGLYVAFLLGWSNEQSGYVAGVVVACYMLGQFISSKFWGMVSDRYGRRVPLVAGMWVTAAMMLLFGVSHSVVMACLVRFVQGLANGSVLIARTVVAEITDATNAAKAFSCISFSWGFGSCIGSLLGGYLYDSVTRFGADPNSFLGRYPAFIPALVCAVYMFSVWAATMAFLPETNVRRRAIVDILPRRIADGLARRFAAVARSRAAAEARLAELEAKQAAATAESTEAGRDPAVASPTTCSADGKGAAVEGVCGGALSGDEITLASPLHPRREPVFSATETQASRFTYLQAARTPGTRYLTIIIGLWAAADIAYSECLPLYGIASVEVGGLGVYSDMVSILTLAMGAPTILANLVFPWLCGKVADKRKLFRAAMAVWIVLTCAIPAAGYMGKLGESAGYWYVFSLGIPRQASLSVVYGLCWLLVPRVAPREHIGETNGLVNSAASLMRCVTPIPASVLFALSVASPGRPFPINHYLIFLIAALGGIATFILSYFLPIAPDRPLREAAERGKDEAAEAARTPQEEEEEVQVGK